ncbi:MAG: type II toxin-antitoxin system RelE/ParE family toxin [Clostridia bacterium]|nr:type II toxin-antitoxin system RelE/ParE family toxin [Clostridia bacterium]
MYRIILTQRAKLDYESAYNYIYYNLANPIAAKRFKDKIPKTISYLQIFPFMGKRFQNTNLRFTYFKNYLIFYSVENQKVKIQRILYKRQNFTNKF